MKRIILIILFVFINMNSYNQYISYRNKLGLSGFFFINEVFRLKESEVSDWADKGKGFRFGFNYSRRIRYNIWINSGLYYLNATNIYHSAPGSPSILQNTHIFQLPLRLEYHFTFNEWLYFKTGLNMDYQFRNKEGLFIDNQTGIGYSMEGGVEIELKKDIFINLGPEIQVLSIIPFKPDKHQQHYAILGLNILLGYDL